MTKRHLPSDGDAAIADLARRVRQLEAAKPQQAASIQAGMTKVVSPTGERFAGVGHAAGRAGFLLPSGSSWVTVQEWTGAQLSALSNGLQEIIGVVNSRVDNVDGRLVGLNSFVGTLNSRVDVVDVKATNAGNAATAAQTTANGRVTQAQLNAVIDYAVALTNAFNAHMDQYHGGNGKPNQPPPVKG